MIRRLRFTSVLTAVAAAALVGGATTVAPVALTGMSTPIASHSAAAAKCPANSTSGTIGGKQKCLAAGQQCQQANVKDYTQFGFSCAKVGNRYQLSKGKTGAVKGMVGKAMGKAKPPAPTTKH